MKKYIIPGVPVLVVVGYVAAVLTPDLVARTRAAVDAAAVTLATPPPEPEPMSADGAFALLDDQERVELEVLRMARERDQAIQDLAHQLMVNQSLEAQLRLAEDVREVFRALSEEVIDFGLSRPPLMLRPMPPGSPSVEDIEGTTAGTLRADANASP